MSLFALIVIFLASVQASSSYTIIPLTTALSDTQSKTISKMGFDGYEPSTYGLALNPVEFYRNYPELRLHGVQKAYNEKRNKKIVFFHFYGNHYLVVNGDKEVISFFAKPDFNFDFNIYSSEGDCTYTHTSDLFYNGSDHNFDTSNMTILQIAVLYNKPEVVKHILSLELTTTKLQLDKSINGHPKDTARSIARKMLNQRDRNKMLEILKVDQSKHDLTKIKTTLKEDLSISVKEAVIENSMEMLESALLLGNYGDKNDETIMRYAVKSCHYTLIEALVMEGYVIPTIPSNEFAVLNKLAADFISLNKRSTSRVPYDTHEHLSLCGRRSFGSPTLFVTIAKKLFYLFE